jgi:hypothetical protein
VEAVGPEFYGVRKAEAAGEIELVGGGFIADFGGPSKVVALGGGWEAVVAAMVERQANLPLAAQSRIAVSAPQTTFPAQSRKRKRFRPPIRTITPYTGDTSLILRMKINPLSAQASIPKSDIRRLSPVTVFLPLILEIT